MLESVTDRTKQLKVLLSDEEKDWLDALAQARGLTASDVLRQYIRNEHAALEERNRILAGDGEDDFIWKEWHAEIVGIVAATNAPIARDDIAERMPQYPAGGPFWKAIFPRALNELVRNGYLRRFTSGYSCSRKGHAAAES